jgi:hypothetical protein
MGLGTNPSQRNRSQPSPAEITKGKGENQEQTAIDPAEIVGGSRGVKPEKGNRLGKGVLKPFYPHLG